MALVSPVPTIKLPVGPIRYGEIRVMASTREIVEEPVAQVIEEKMYVALGKEVKENRSILIWALHNSGGKRICIIHVHVPAQMIPLLGTKFPASSLKEQEVRAYREIERQSMENILNEYLVICSQMGVRAERYFIEKDCIEEGILELISRHGIRKLVMGAAAEKHCSKKMMDLKSKKAIYVRLEAPASCHIWFVCKGSLIHTREGISEGAGIEVASSSLQASPSIETGQSNHLRSQSLPLGHNNFTRLTNPAQDLFSRIKFGHLDGRVGRVTRLTSPDGTAGLTSLRSRLDTEESFDEQDRFSRMSLSQSSNLSSSSSSPSYPGLRTGERDSGLDLAALPQFKEVLHHSSPPSVLDGNIDGPPLYEQLEQAMTEAENSRREAFEEAIRRGKAEKGAIEAIRKAKASEAFYNEEFKLRKEIEEALAKEQEELEKIKREQEGVMEELQFTLDEKLLLERQVAECDEMVKELEQKIISAVELLQNYKKERDELQMERDNALKEAEDLRKSRAEASTANMPRFYSEFSFTEIGEACHNFDPSLKIGEGGYGSIYRGVLRHTQVAIKMLHSYSLQGPSEFQQEVDVLSKTRHPNLVTLIGACPEAWTLIYEYLPNGSLEDRLSCRDNSPPLSWQTRIRIAAELCSVLIFLHSSKPHSVVHGDLKPANILLDANFVSKLSDFGISRLLSHDGTLSSNSTLCCRTDPKGTFAYMDPEFLATGELTPKSDVFSFGIILLRLMTGRQALGIIKEVQYALDKGNLKTLLDPLAGDWPFVQAEQLAYMALRCCEMNRRCRPDLGSEVWRILEPMRASCGGSSSFRLGSEEHCQPPPYFICPIFQEVMRDPHVAADGFTYEAEALRGWLDSGHDTSPMTNIKLEHSNLVPNRALRSAIQEWLQQN
ncbi:Pkinase domain-containing protein/U-box domain-containing protein [Cephalotus follicularis]|uniref:RING-type E3 ubiquitin transferase n=1 Tax=Cephalotus follicularis TaxID=3775 RepID=A0A1Q3CNQ0_CEPFO|nr:Pkinase domain-containing protein/U-box domain-containing protein [Cephalotus follicularis]